METQRKSVTSILFDNCGVKFQYMVQKLALNSFYNAGKGAHISFRLLDTEILFTEILVVSVNIVI